VNALLLDLIVPLLGALALRLVRPKAIAGWLNLAVSVVSLGAALWLAAEVRAEGEVAGALAGPIAGLTFRVDAFNVYLVVLTAFVGVTTSIFSRPYMRHVCDTGRIGPRRLRTYHSMYQLFMFTMLLALTTDNLGVMWVAVEGATLATVLLVSLYRTPEAVEAAWKYFILCGVGIALALFGTVLTYFAAQRSIARPGGRPDLERPVRPGGRVGASGDAARIRLPAGGLWHQGGSGADASMAAGCPFRGADPDVRGPLGAPAQCRPVCDCAAQDAGGRLPGTDREPASGGLSAYGIRARLFLVAGLFLHRQRDIKRMFSYSSIEHMGLMTFAFGLGGPLATFGALLHMLVHSLTKSAIFVTVGHAAHIAGTQSIEHIRGLIRTQPAVGWSLLIGVAAIAGFPPFRRLHERVPAAHGDHEGGTLVCGGPAHRACGGLRRALPAPASRWSMAGSRGPAAGGRPTCSRSPCTWAWSCGWAWPSPGSWPPGWTGRPG
jgi:hydrogenase-4 component F